jgi:hypothetical protein
MKNMKYQKKIIDLLFLPTVIFGLIISGSFFKSAIAANGKPQLATKNKSNFFFNSN